MLDGLKQILIDFFKWAMQPFEEMVKDIFCWILKFLVSLVGSVMTIATSFFPSSPVPRSLLSTLDEIHFVLNFLNWVFPLPAVGLTMSLMFFMFAAYFVFVPFYRAVMDLL